MIYLLIFSFLLIVFIDYTDLLKANRKYLAFTIYGLLILSGFTVSMLLLIDKAPVSPAVIIEKLINLILGR